MRNIAFVVLVALLVGCGPGGPPELDLSEQPPTGGNVPPTPLPPGGSGGSGGGSVPAPPELAGGVVATLVCQGETFHVFTRDVIAATDLETAWNGAFTIPAVAGQSRRGPGLANHNVPWSWHLEPDFLLVDNPPATYVWIPESVTWPSSIEYYMNNIGDRHWLAVFFSVTVTGFADYR